MQTFFKQDTQAVGVIDIDAVTGDKGQPLLVHHLHRGHVVGFHHQLAVFTQALCVGQFGLCLDQGQAGEHRLLACAGQLLAEFHPFAGPNGTTLGAHGLAQVDDIQRLLRHFKVKGANRVCRPQERDVAQGQFHVCAGIHHTAYCHGRE